MLKDGNMNKSRLELWRKAVGDIGTFSRVAWPKQTLRPYQLDPARAIAQAVQANLAQVGELSPGEQPSHERPNQFVVVFSRQAGKDEMAAQLLAYLLSVYQWVGGQIVVAAPTIRQATISKERLLARMQNPFIEVSQKVAHREGYIVELGQANARFLSAAPSANVRGETASLLLIANEAQNIEPERWDAVFDPMAASTNATTVFMGTVWTAQTLLARQMRHLRQLEQQDGQPRVFLVDWAKVAEHVPAYGRRVRERITQFGEHHPFIQTEYLLKELNGIGGLFGPERRALMVGSHLRRESAEPGKTYALLVDIAGEGEANLRDEELRNLAPRKDSTAITVVEIVGSKEPKEPMTELPEIPFSSQTFVPQLPDFKPTYRVVNRYVWTGIRHSELYGRLVGLARETWQARLMVVDATGLGGPVASFLAETLAGSGCEVRPFVFSAASKSKLGWNFCGLIDSGRFKDYARDQAPDTEWWWRQLAAVEYEVRPGPGQLLRWSVPDPTLHDDLVMSAALVAVLDEEDFRPRRAIGTFRD